jgi:PRTRC genetic system protein E
VNKQSSILPRSIQSQPMEIPMFRQLVPLLRQRSVLLTVTSLEDDQIRVNVIPKKMKEGENNALTTPMSFTGTAVELDEQLPDAIVSFVASHLELKHTLARAKEEMDAATKAAQEEARNKAKNDKKTSSEPARKAETVAKEESKKEPEPPRLPGLFEIAADAKPSLAAAVASVPVVAAPTDAPNRDADEESDILAEIAVRDRADLTSDQEVDEAY